MNETTVTRVGRPSDIEVSMSVLLPIGCANGNSSTADGARVMDAEIDGILADSPAALRHEGVFELIAETRDDVGVDTQPSNRRPTTRRASVRTRCLNSSAGCSRTRPPSPLPATGKTSAHPAPRHHR
jgi:hypothetical protein